MRSLLLSSALVLAAAQTPAQADVPYTPDQIVEALIATVDLGASRAICIGTVEECTPEPVAGLDMMVNFDLDSYELRADALEVLSVFATALQDERLSVAGFLVEGHTDARGGPDYNMDLSERRAASVTAHLVGLGVAPERISATGFGLTRPRTEDPFDAVNRRVELRLTLD